jgi:hypothetical protein
MKKNEKGFISTLDTVFALLALLIFSTIIFSYLQKTPDINDVFIYRQAYDIMTVLEYTNFSNPSSVFINTPSSLCMRLEVYDSTMTLLSTYYKTNCDASNINEKITWRTFIDGQNIRMAKLAVWRKEG